MLTEPRHLAAAASLCEHIGHGPSEAAASLLAEPDSCALVSCR